MYFKRLYDDKGIQKLLLWILQSDLLTSMLNFIKMIIYLGVNDHLYDSP